MSKEDLSGILPDLLQGYRFGRYLEDGDLPLATSSQLLRDNILQYINQESAEAILVKDADNKPHGLLLFRVSDWDTKHFGHKTVLLDHIIIRKSSEEAHLLAGDHLLEKFRTWCSQHEVKFVVSKTPSLDLLTIHGLEKAGFRFMESWIFNKYDLRKTKAKPENHLKLRLADRSDIEYMLGYAKNAFSTQRFHADFHIPNNKAETLYSKWILTAFEDSKQKILVYDEGNVPCAYMAYYILDLTAYYNQKFAMWKMALMNPQMTGKGIGSRFFSSVCDYHREIEHLDVVDSGLSLRNIVSLNTHNKINFKVVSTIVSMHLWL